MANPTPKFTCPSHVGPCGDVNNLNFDFPFKNLSAEAPDQNTFVGINNGWGILDPVLGSWFTALDCFGVCESTVSQSDADLCAARANLQCRAPSRPPTGPVETSGPPLVLPIGPTLQLFSNTVQQCTAVCPDGLNFTFQVRAGLFIATSQILADREAQTYACQLALQNAICLGSLAAGACVGMPYVSSVTTTFGGVAPITFNIIAGGLPPGLFQASGANQRTFVVVGTPTTPGNYSFTLQAVDARGNFMTKNYTINVLGFTNSPPNATIGSAYNFSFAVAGGTPGYSFAVIAGTLPNGLLMDGFGNFTGTPNTIQTSMFTVQMTDSNGLSCSQQFTIKVSSGCPSIIDTISSGPFPAGVLTQGACYAPTPNILIRNSRIFISRLNSLAWIENATLIGSTNLAGGSDEPLDMAYAPSSNSVYAGVSSPGFNAYIQVQNANTGALITTIAIGSTQTPGYLRYNSTKDRLYATWNDGAVNFDLLVINPNTNAITNTVALVAFTDNLFGVDFCPTNNLPKGTLYIGHFISAGVGGEILVLDATTFALITTISLGNFQPFDVMYDADLDRIVVAAANQANQQTELVFIKPSTNTIDTTLLIDTNNFITSIRLGYDSVAKHIYVWSGSMHVIDGSVPKLVCNVTMPNGPGGLPFNLSNNKLYAPIIGIQTVDTLQ